jgi:hypothetical protein
VRVGRDDRPVPRGRDRVADALGAGRNLGRIDHPALIVERLARVVLTVRVGGEREHAVAVAHVPTTTSADPAGSLGS